MPLLDIIILVPVVWFTIKGFRKGLIIELASLAGLVVGIYIAYFFSDITATFLTNKLNFTSNYLQPIAFILTFAIVVILIFLLARFLEGVIKTVSLGFVNKLGGAIFGGLKIALICGLCLYQLSIFDVNNKFISNETKEKSYSYKPLIQYSLLVMPLLKKVKSSASQITPSPNNDKDD